MKIAIVAPSPIPFTVGGAEKLWWGLLREINTNTPHQAELIKIPTKELSFWDLVDSYETFFRLDLSYFDLVISTKYPAWMVSHPRHICYMQHRLRGFYDCFHFNNLPEHYQSDHAGIKSLQHLLSAPAPSRAAFEEAVQLMRALRFKPDIPTEAFRFPGSLIKEIVHFFDRVGLQHSTIQSYAAISRTVANRLCYFPDEAEVKVVYHPSNLEQFQCGDARYIFTASRLDQPKRIGLLIEAMRFVTANIELRIAGDGPDKARLLELAGNDPRITFLGFRSDSELITDYADALAVVFLPYDEDYGLITIEAMMSGKPVITVEDSGGPTEFVKNGETGLCVAPQPAVIGQAIDWIACNREAAAVMGATARERVQSITWSNTVESLLGDASKPSSNGIRPRRTKKLTVATTFAITPVRGGGQARIFNFYKNLFPEYETELITLGSHEAPGFVGEIAPGMREIRTPRSKAHTQAESEICRDVEWFPVTDVAFPELAHLTPAYLEALEQSSKRADIVVACHPYAFPLIERAAKKPLWYEAQDVEALLKSSVMPKTARGLALIEQVRKVEQECCAGADLIFTCSETDRDDLVNLYHIRKDGVRIVPNGIDCAEVPFISRQESMAAKKRLGFERAFTCVFVGSWHEPNLRAVRVILTLARECPHVYFMALGSSCLAFENVEKPKNVSLMGIVDDATKAVALSVADVALNPMEIGSGTNLKMLEYAAAGIPILTTTFGMRGLGFENGSEVSVVEISNFARGIELLRGTDRSRLESMTQRARQRAEADFDWRSISRRFLASI